MPLIAIIALLDRFQPQYVQLRWALNECSFIVGDESVIFDRALIADVSNLLRERGYREVSSDIDPRGGIEGETRYAREIPKKKTRR
ncbi:hypothetical protein QPK87_29350 [Kamptonema cortianum]|jgi:hypothetical protein|nr:hypothetical protein [Kamptonema cortianum]